MTIPVSSLFVPKTPQQWLTQILTDAQTQGLTSTSWQAGDPVLTILAILAEELAKEDSLAISMRAQGCFLDFAASGTVTIVDDLVTPATSVTVPVTPDPSVPAQLPSWNTGALLDVLASSVYNVKRAQASAATGTLYLTNTSGTSLGTFASGTFHVQNVLTGATYSNQVSWTNSSSSKIGTSVSGAVGPAPVSVTTSANHGLSTGNVVFAQSLGIVADGFYQVTVTGLTTLTLNGSVIAGTFPGPNPPGPNLWTVQAITFAADNIGPPGNAGIGNINQIITASPKCFCGNLATFAGAPYQSNVSLATLCRAKLATLSPNGPPGAYVYFAIVATNILGGTAINNAGLILQSPIPQNMSLDGGAITRAFVSTNSALGLVTVTIANAGGPVGGTNNNPITGATAATPIVITSPAHGLLTSDWAQVAGVQGLVGANGQWQVTRIDANNVSLNGSVGSGVYTGGTGLLSGGDVYAVGAVLQAYATPNAVTQITQSAAAVSATITATVYVPSSFVSDYTSKMTAALTAYFTSFPIGGLNVDQALNVLPLGAIEGILYSAGQQNGLVYTLSVFGVLINGSSNDLSLGPTGVAVLGVLTGIKVVGQ